MSFFNKKVRSLTFLELIITVTIVSVIAVSLFAAFQTGIASYKRIDKSSDTYQTARMLFDRIDKDLKNSYAYLKEDSGFNGQSQTLGFFSVNEVYAAGGSTAVARRLFYERQGSHVVRFSLPTTDTLAAQATAPSVVAYNVKEVSFQYALAAQAQAAGNAYEWVDVWPVDQAQKGEFPAAVKVTLVLIKPDQAQAAPVEFTSICSLPRSGSQ